MRDEWIITEEGPTEVKARRRRPMRKDSTGIYREYEMYEKCPYEVGEEHHREDGSVWRVISTYVYDDGTVNLELERKK